MNNLKSVADKTDPCIIEGEQDNVMAFSTTISHITNYKLFQRIGTGKECRSKVVASSLVVNVESEKPKTSE